MSSAMTAHPVAAVRFGSTFGASVARAALRKQWSMLEGDQPGLVRGLLSRKTRVMFVQLDGCAADSIAAALSLVGRLAAHFNPVKTVVVGSEMGDYEFEARCAGAAAYFPAGVSPEVLENIADQLLESGPGGTDVVNGDLDRGPWPPVVQHGIRSKRA